MASYPCFEFLIKPDLLEEYLDGNNEVNPIDLIVNFLNNANADGSVNGSLGGTELYKLLSVKVGAYIDFNLDILENQLPIVMQYTLIKALIKFVESSSPPASVLKAVHLKYYRWILRSIIRLSYPTRGPRGLSIPPQMMQQLDPCYVPIEALENMFKKLKELSPDALNSLESFLDDENGSPLCEPLITCFPSRLDANSNAKCDWTKVKELNLSDLHDIVHYELGKWYFFNENYNLAVKHFSTVNSTKLKDESFTNLSHYLESSREICSEVSIKDSGSKTFETLFEECLSNVKKGASCDLSFVERTVDLQLIAVKLNQFYSQCANDEEKTNVRRFSFYLMSRINGIKELIPGIIEPISKPLSNGIDSAMNFVNEGEEEGEIDGGEDEIERNPELLLLEATVPEMIQDLIPKVNKSPLLINRNWAIPGAHARCLQNLPPPQYNKCHIALAKAAELRRAKMYIESRILYLSLLEDYQASLPTLADIITFELLETDLQHHVESNDIDERRILELLAKCDRTLRNETLIASLPLELVDLCCLFLLESSPQTLKDFSSSKHPLLRLSSLLSSLASADSLSHHPMKAKDLWDLICNFLPYDGNLRINPINKRPIHLPPTIWTLDIFCQFVKKLKNSAHINLLTSCLIKILNLKRDISGVELTLLPFPTFQWPTSLPPISANINLEAIFDTLKVLLKKGLSLKPNENNLLRCRAELAIIEGQYADAMASYLTLMIITTEYFTVFGTYPEEEKLIQRMIHCSTKLGCHTQAAVLHQMVKEPNYGLIFKGLSEKSCNDSCDDLYDSFWDVTILEYLVNLHTRRGEIDRKNKSLHLIGQSELNANNPEDILTEAANVRKGKFFRTLAKKYL